MRSKIQIGKRALGDDEKVFVIAESGVTCNYDVTIAKDLIDVVRESGADAIKLIFWFPEEIMSDKTVVYSYDTVNGPCSENMYDMLAKLRFTLEQWQEIKAYADSRGVLLFATVNSPSGVEYAERLGIEAYKLSSWDYNCLPLWKRIAELGKPMLIDTGPVNTLEVATVMQIMKDASNDQSVLLHCPHTDDDAEINMRSIPYMRAAFNTLVGYSAKGRAWYIDLLAVALGAHVLEKRLTMSRQLPGHHHVLSLEPNEFAEYVRTMRDAQIALGVYDLRPTSVDLAERPRWFRRIVANRDIPKGTVLTADMLAAKRPESGVSPAYLDFFVGRVVKRDIAYNEPVTWNDV